jgi:hypothetical protein
MSLGLTQPVTEMSTRNISWVIKAAGALGWLPYHLHVPTVLKSGNQTNWTLRPVQACNRVALPYYSVQTSSGYFITRSVVKTVKCRVEDRRRRRSSQKQMTIPHTTSKNTNAKFIYFSFFAKYYVIKVRRNTFLSLSF